MILHNLSPKRRSPHLVPSASTAACPTWAVCVQGIPLLLPVERDLSEYDKTFVPIQ